MGDVRYLARLWRQLEEAIRKGDLVAEILLRQRIAKATRR